MISCLFVFLSIFSFAQYLQKEKIKLFVDCSSTWCDMDYIKTEINLVDYTPDNKIADVHVLITEQSNGGGGSQYQLIFFGQNKFTNIKDTIRFNLDANNTGFENRELLVKNLKLGLFSFVSKTEAAKNIVIQMKQTDEEKSKNKIAPTKDPWNYWVFNINTNGRLNGDKNYKGTSFSGNVSVNRITDLLKLSFSVYANKNKTKYSYEDPRGVDPPFKYVDDNHSFGFEHQLVKSINQHWSYGYNLNLYNSTFSNYKLQSVIGPAIEYNIFPYKESNNKFLTIRYSVDIRNNQYIDSTLYAKKHETLPGHGASVALSFNQKWGGASVGFNYHHYFLNNWKYFNLGLNGSLNVRITGGLSFRTGFFGGLVRDQLSLSGKNVDQNDILTRRRQLASNYNYYTYFGITYRFGSKLNNFVNPRFDGGNGNFFF